MTATGSGKATINADCSLSIVQTGHLGTTPLTAEHAARFGLPPSAAISGVMDEGVAPTGNFTSGTLKHGLIQTDIRATLA